MRHQLHLITIGVSSGQVPKDGGYMPHASYQGRSLPHEPSQMTRQITRHVESLCYNYVCFQLAHQDFDTVPRSIQEQHGPLTARRCSKQEQKSRSKLSRSYHALSAIQRSTLTSSARG